MKLLKAALIIATTLTTLSACQSLPFGAGKDARKVNSNAKSAQHTQLSCTGVPSCAFERVRQWQGSALKAYEVNTDAAPNRTQHLLQRLRFKDRVPALMQRQTLQLPADEYEVVIHFYPISPERAEVFHVIHAFKPQQQYVFKMYRKRDASAGSLLNVSTPDPLCVDLTQAEQVIRRFCRTFDAAKGTGEYVEQKL